MTRVSVLHGFLWRHLGPGALTQGWLLGFSEKQLVNLMGRVCGLQKLRSGVPIATPLFPAQTNEPVAQGAFGAPLRLSAAALGREVQGRESGERGGEGIEQTVRKSISYSRACTWGIFSPTRPWSVWNQRVLPPSRMQLTSFKGCSG